jgi:hypothetical protein
MLAHADAQQCDAMHEAAQVERAVGSLESTAHALESTAAHAVSLLLLQLQYQQNTHCNLLAAREELRIAQEDAKVAVEDAKDANRQVLHPRHTRHKTLPSIHKKTKMHTQTQACVKDVDTRPT